jgi:RHS repeat-associated protein
LSYLTAGSAKCSGEPSNVCTRTDARGIVTTYYYDALNRLTKKTYSDSNTATAVFNYDETSRFGVSLTNTKGRPSSQYTLDSSNNVIGGSVYSYDAAGRITNNSQCTPRNCASGTYSISYGYSLGGQMTASTNGQGVAFTYQYDGLGRLTALLSSLNDATHPGTLLSNVHYNAINAPSSASTGDALSESYTYNSRLQRTVFTTGSQTGGPPVPGTGTITLNGNEQTIQNGGQSAAAGVGSVTFAGTINSVQRQDCHTEWIWNPDYDEGYEGTVCDPPYTYYDSGRVTVYIGSYSKTIYYSYTSTPDSLAEDLRSQLITDGSSPVTAVRTGAQVTMTAKATGAGTNYSLSTSGATDDYGTFYGPSFSATPASAYFQGGRDYIPASTTYDAGTVTVTVNGYSKQVTYGQGSTKEAVASSLAAAFHNDATAPVDGVLLDSVTVRLTSRTAGASTNYTLNTSSATTQGSFASASFTASRSGATLSGGAANSPNTVYQYSLGYTPNGNINSANDSINGNWTHTYDLLDRLGNSSKTGVNLGFGYDVFGNRTQAASQNLSYDPITNKIASGNGITYDPVGNITVENTGAVTHTYTYDAENRIISVDSGATALYFYDAVGHRIRKTNSGSAFDWQYLYDLAGNQISEIKGSDGAWTRGEVFVGARRLATYINTTSPGITQFNYADWARTDRVRTSMSGNAVLTCTGQPYGDNLSCSGSSPDYSPFHYGTYARDLESNLDFANFRYYNSRLGRFMGVDLLNGNASSPQTLNKFAYVANNPLNALDPSGLDMTDIQPDYDDHNGSWGAAGGGGGFVATQGRTYTVDGIQVSAGFANTLLQSGGVVACGLCGSIVTNSNGEIVDVVRAVFTGNGLEIGFGEAPGGAPAPVYANGPIPVYVGQRRIQNPWIKIFTFGLARHSYFSLTGSDGATHQFEVLGNPGSSHNQQVRDTFGTNRQSSCGTGCEHVVWVSEAQRDALIGGSQYFLSHPCPTCTGGQEGYNLIFHNSNSFVYNMLQFNPAGSIAPPPSAFFTPGYVMRPDNWYPGRP